MRLCWAFFCLCLAAALAKIPPRGTPRARNHRTSILSIYAEYNPRKVRDVDRLLAEWDGEEDQLLACIEAKYLGQDSSMSVEDRYRVPAEAYEDSELLPGMVATPQAPAKAEEWGERQMTLGSIPWREDSSSDHQVSTTAPQPRHSTGETTVHQINEQFLQTYGIQVKGYDKHEVEEAQAEGAVMFDSSTARRNHNTINPENRFRMTWNIVQSVILMYVAVVVPFRIGFDIVLEPFTGAWWFEAVVDTFFIVDSEYSNASMQYAVSLSCSVAGLCVR